MDDILQVKDLRTYFYTAGKEIPAVDGVSFSVRRGEDALRSRRKRLWQERYFHVGDAADSRASGKICVRRNPL